MTGRLEKTACACVTKEFDFEQITKKPGRFIPGFFVGSIRSATRVTRSTLIHKIVDALGELDVEIGDASDVVGGEFESHLGVFDGDVRVVLSFLSDLADVVHEINSIHEFLELE